MTVADNTSRNQYTATSGQTVFAYTFEIVDKDHIVVLQNGTALSEGTDYTVSNVGNDNGGNVTLTSGATAGDVMTLYREMPYSRTQNYTNSGDFLASEVNADFDELWLAGEQTDRSFSQSIRKPITDSDSISMELPEAATRANKFVKFDATGAVDVAGATVTVSAEDVSIDDAGNYYTSDNVEGALQEVGASLDTKLENVVEDTTPQLGGNLDVNGNDITGTGNIDLTGNLDVSGTATVGAVTYTGTDGTDGQVLMTDGAGNASFEDMPSSTYLDVKDFGATGDGSTDDTTAIQNAINHASNNEIQTIFFPDGHYKYTTLRFYHDATDNPNFQETPNRDGRFQLRGTGRLAITDLKNVGKSPNRIYGSILESTSTGDGLIVEPTGTFQTTTDARNFVVKDLTLVADNTGYIVTAESCPGITFDHCSFKQLNHQGSGILARNCWFFTMNQCYVFGQSWIDEDFATAGQTEFSYTFDNPASTSDIIVQKKGGLVSSSDYTINTTTKVVTLNTGADLNDKVTISRKNTGDGISSQFVGSAFGSFAGLWNITDSLVDSWANGVHWTGGQVTNLSLRNTGVQNCNNYNIYADAGVIQQMLLDNVYMENQSVQGVSFIKSDGSGISSAAIRNLRMINCFMLAGGTFPRVTGTCIDIDSIDVIDIEGMYVYRMRQPFLNITATKNSQNVPGEIKNSIFATDQDLSAEPTIYLLSGKIPNVHNCVWPGFNDGFYDTTNDILLFDPSVDSNFPRQFTDIKGTTGTAKFGFGDTVYQEFASDYAGAYNIAGSTGRTYYNLKHEISTGLKVVLPDTGEVNDGRLMIIKNNEQTSSSFPYINVVNNSGQNATLAQLAPGQAGLFIVDVQSQLSTTLTATSGQTDFVWTFNNDSGNVAVKQNGTQLIPSEYSSNNATNTVTLTTGATAGDTIEIYVGTFRYVGRVFSDDLYLSDNQKISFGRSDDLQLFHQSSDSTNRLVSGGTSFALPTADGSAGQSLTTDGSGNLTFSTAAGTGITAVVEDTTPQLGGDLESNGHDILFADNDKAVFGAGSDLQIFHDGNNSYIQENGTGDLLVGATNFQLKSGDYGESMLTATDDGAVTLFYNNASKLATTNTGIDVTGSINTVLSVDGTTEDVFITGAVPALEFVENDSGGSRMRMAWATSGSFSPTLYQSLYGDSTTTYGGINIQTRASDASGNQVVYAYDPINDRNWWGTRASGDVLMQLQSDGTFNVRGGDVSFENAAATSDDFFWDASTSRLGLGETNPQATLHTVGGSAYGEAARFENNGDAVSWARADWVNDQASGTGIIYRDQAGTFTLRNDNSSGTAMTTQILAGGSTDGNIVFKRNAGSNSAVFQTTSTGDVIFYDDDGFTQGMRWDASTSRLGLGITNPSYDLSVVGSSAAIQVDNTAGSPDQILQLWQADMGTNDRGIQLKSPLTDSNADFFRFATGNSIAFELDGANALSIASNKRIGIGTDLPSHLLDVEGVSDPSICVRSTGTATTDDALMRIEVGGTTASSYLMFGDADDSSPGRIRYVHSDDSMRIYAGGAVEKVRFTSNQTLFYNGATEAARFDSTNNFLVGTTSTSPHTTSNPAEGGLRVSQGGMLAVGRNSNPALNVNRITDDGLLAMWYRNGVNVGNISVTSSATTYNTSSDQRLKDNIVDAPSASDDIDAIQVRSFDWKADGSHQKYGMVAQELQTVAPDAVSEGDTEEDMMGVDYSKLVPMLVKEIQSLRARVAQLEND